MFQPLAPAIDAFAKCLAANYREVFGKAEPDHAHLLRATAGIRPKEPTARASSARSVVTSLLLDARGANSRAHGPAGNERPIVLERQMLDHFSVQVHLDHDKLPTAAG
jgi:hypothetical protein